MKLILSNKIKPWMILGIFVFAGLLKFI